MSKISPFPWILVTLLISISYPVFAQQKVWRHFTSDDGLPGQQVWSVIQAKNGYIWFSTDKGLCWYDGYRIHQPVDTSASKNSEAFFPFEDKNGRIWFTRIDKSVWYVENDSVHYWIHNSVIEPYKENFFIFEQCWIDKEGSIWLNMRGGGLLVVDKDGHAKPMSGSANSNFFIVRKNDQVFYSFHNRYKEEMNWHKATIDLLLLENTTSYKLDEVKYSNASSAHYWNAIPWTEKEILLSYGHHIVLLENGKVKTTVHSPISDAQVLRTQNDQIYLAGSKREEPGLMLYKNWEQFVEGKGTAILHNYFIRGMLCDREGGIWLAASRDGVFYCKNPDIEVFDSSNGLESDKVLRLATDSKNFVFAGLDSKNLFQIEHHSGDIKKIGTNQAVINWMALHYDSHHHRLYTSSELSYLQGSAWNKIMYYNPLNGQVGSFDIKKFSEDPLDDYLWMSSSYGFFRLDTKQLQAERMNYMDSVNLGRTYAVQKDLKGRLWVATINGLRVWENDGYSMPPFRDAFLRNEIRDIVMMEDGTLVFGSQGDGILICQDDLKRKHITITDGLLSESISMLKIGAPGEVFICSNKGLNQLIRDVNGDWKIKSFTTRHGLPSNIVHDVVRLNEQIWIGTDKGLVRINSIPDEVQVTAPSILSFQADHQDVTLLHNNTFSYDQNNITIQFRSLHFKSEGDILYRYRLLNADTTFQLTRSLGVNYPELAPGKYIFEVQAQREDNSWTASSQVSFEINPPWWKTLWFISFCVLAFGFLTAWIVRNRLNDDRKKAHAELRMKELELSALRAQINPHFIFNCLSSIQQFIAENNTDTATRYLAKFAKLIRIALHSSVDGQHSLADEMEMLDNYLALEQMRFKNKFTYTVQADHGLAVDDLFIPAMLLQPFVENSVIHGIKGKSEKGLIHVQFSMPEGKLIATITDNGPGFSNDLSSNGYDHKSVGMTLTGKRLALINRVGNGNGYQRQNLLNESNQVIGSKVIVDISVN